MLANNEMCIFKTVVWLHNGKLWITVKTQPKDVNSTVSQFVKHICIATICLL